MTCSHHPWIELLPDAVCVTDLSGCLKVSNRIFRMSLRPISNILELLPPSVLEDFISKVNDSSQEEVKYYTPLHPIDLPCTFDWKFQINLASKEVVFVAR